MSSCLVAKIWMRVMVLPHPLVTENVVCSLGILLTLRVFKFSFRKWLTYGFWQGYQAIWMDQLCMQQKGDVMIWRPPFFLKLSIFSYLTICRGVANTMLTVWCFHSLLLWWDESIHVWSSLAYSSFLFVDTLGYGIVLSIFQFDREMFRFNIVIISRYSLQWTFIVHGCVMQAFLDEVHSPLDMN